MTDGLLVKCPACEAHTFDVVGEHWISVIPAVGEKLAVLCSWDCVRRHAARQMGTPADRRRSTVQMESVHG